MRNARIEFDFALGDRVVFLATGEHGVIDSVRAHQDGFGGIQMDYVMEYVTNEDRSRSGSRVILPNEVRRATPP